MPAVVMSISENDMTAHARGLATEKAAALLLRLKGYKILAQRYKTPSGEIDIIAAKGRTVSFVEVKRRRDTDTALYAISPRAQRRITQTAEIFLAENPQYADYNMRFDVISQRSGHFPMHHKNMWQNPV